MNYKINQLNNPIECSQIKFPDIEALKYGKVAEGKADTITVFNATSFSVSIGINIDVSTFMRTQKNYIDRLIHENIVKADKLFFVDKDNNVYISTGLEIIFLMFSSKDYQIYFFELLEDILTNGMAFSDGLILKMAMERIPNDTLQEIVYHRNEQKK